MAESFLFEEGLFVMLVHDALLHDMFLHPSPSWCYFSASLKDCVQFWARANNLCNFSPGALVFQLSQNLLVGRTVQRVVLGVVRRVVEVLVLGHVIVHVLDLHLKEKAVSVRVEELAALSVLRFELVVIEAVCQVLREIQNAHAPIHRAIEH